MNVKKYTQRGKREICSPKWFYFLSNLAKTEGYILRGQSGKSDPELICSRQKHLSAAIEFRLNLWRRK